MLDHVEAMGKYGGEFGGEKLVESQWIKPDVGTEFAMVNVAFNVSLTFPLLSLA